MNDLVSIFHQSRHPVQLGNVSFNSLLYADAIVLLSTKAEGLQKCLSELSSYCADWGLSVNLMKTKIMIFNKCSKLVRERFASMVKFCNV
jgi:hypothetical protein